MAWFFSRRKEQKKEKDEDFELETSTEKIKLSDLRKVKLEHQKTLMEIELQKAKLELEKAKLELEEAQEGDFNPYDWAMDMQEQQQQGSNPDSLFMGLLMQLLAKGIPQQQQQPPQQAPPQQIPQALPQQTTLSDDEIIQIKNSIPKSQQGVIKALPDGIIINYIKDKYPNLDDDTIKRGLKILKE